MESRHLSCIVFFVLFSCRCGLSYRIFILPEQDSFCLGVFSGDPCITWSEYAARPAFVDHDTTLVFTPGNYSLSRTFSVANIKSFTMIGQEGARLLFRMSLKNIGYVGLHNLTLNFIPNNRIEVRSVKSFLMKNCNFSRDPGSASYYYGLNLYGSNLNRIIDCVFVMAPINVWSSSNDGFSPVLSVRGSTFYNSTSPCIRGNSRSVISICDSKFVNNTLNNQYGIIYTQSASTLTIDSCSFDRNGAQRNYYRYAVVYSSSGDLTILNSLFTNNQSHGTAVVQGQRNIFIRNCTFEKYTSRIIYANAYSTRQGNSYQVYITDSRFSHGNQYIQSNGNVTVTNSSFYNITTGGNSVVYSTTFVTAVDCTFTNVSVRSNGGVVYSGQGMNIQNSTFISSQAMVSSSGRALYSAQGDISVTNGNFCGYKVTDGCGGTIYSARRVILTNTNIVNSTSRSAAFGCGGAVYSGSDVSLINSTIQGSTSSANGGAIYSGSKIELINSSIIECSAQTAKGGAVYSAARPPNSVVNDRSSPNILFLRSTFSHNSASSGGVLYVSGYYDHHMEFSDSVFVSNEATSGSGGVIFMGNTSLSINNSTFINNTAATDGGVMDTSFSNVRIAQSSLSHSRAGDNGGVFFGRNYSTNFTLVDTKITNNAARNGSGGVFYVRRFNSNIRLSDCTFTGNHANEQGGVMDIRGVTVEIDVDTIIANNTANIAGDVISACLCRINSHGLDVQPDTTYPMYCSIYDQGNGTHSDVSVLGIASSTTEVSRQTHVNMETTVTNNVMMTATESEWDHIPVHTSAATGSSSKQTSTYHDIVATTSSEKGIPNTITSKTSGPFVSTDHSTTGYVHFDRTTPQNTPAQTTPKQVAIARTTMARFTATMKDVTDSPLQTTYVHIPDPTPLPSSPPNKTSATTNSASFQGTVTAKHTRQTTPPTFSTAQNPSEMASTTQTITTSSKGIPSLEPRATTEAAPGVSDAQGNQDLEQVVAWKNSEQDILQVAIASLAVLCVVCTAICVIMIVLFFMACKKRSDSVLHSRRHYSKVPLTDKDKEDSLEIKADSLEIKEESFMEI